ncbi:DUF2254 family protein [Thermodesulfobacteriota bacterium]
MQRGLSFNNQMPTLHREDFLHFKEAPKITHKDVMKLTLKINNFITFTYAKFWQKYYRYKNWLSVAVSKNRIVIVIVVFITFAVAMWLLVPKFNSILEPYFSFKDRFENFRTLLMTLGGALIGATAIAFSLIMFAMQVNVERMPYGLFRKFSSDLKLLGSFAITFLLALFITCSYLITDKSLAALIAFCAAWSSALILIFLVFAYRRALNLISPTKQLAILVENTKRNLNAWAKAAHRHEPILRKQRRETQGDYKGNSDLDIDKITYFQNLPNWTAVARRNIEYCVTFTRRHVERGDYETAGFALNAILAINAEYIKAKGKTFFSQNFLIDNPLASDGIINSTLEYLRQNVKIGLSRGDEQQIEQNFKAFEKLCQIYLSIDYAYEHASKYHAHLAAGYLSEAVQTVVPHNMVDVLMEGLRGMGNVAQLILYNKEPTQIITISEKIAMIACAGAVNKKYLPATQIAVLQLAKLTFELIRSQTLDVRFSLERIRDDVKLIAEMLLKTPDTPLASTHSEYLAYYYSGTKNDTLIDWLTKLTNALLKAEKDDEATQRVVYHINQWAEKLYQTEKDIFLLAIEKRSNFTFDIIHWIVHVTKLLLAISNADVCDDRNSRDLRKSALWLISVLSWVPDEKDAVTFAETWQMTESLFETALDAKQRDCDDIALRTRELLLSWAFKAGRHQTGWGTFERAFYGLACLNIIFDMDNDVLLKDIDKRLGSKNAPELAIRLRASNIIREEARSYHDDRFTIRAIENAMVQVDQDKLKILLSAIADQLVPEKINQEETEK